MTDIHSSCTASLLARNALMSDVAPRSSGPAVASLDENDIATVARFHEMHLASETAPDGMGRQERIADVANALVTEALDIVGNDMPEDIRVALNIIIVAAPILDIQPKPGADVARYRNDLKAIEALLGRGANAIADSCAFGEDAEFRQKIAGLLNGLKTEIANTHRCHANGLPADIAAGDSLSAGGTVRDHYGHGLRLLQMTPSNAESARRLVETMRRTLAALPKPLDGDAAFESKYPGVSALRSNIEKRIDILEQGIALNPLSRKTVFEAKTHAVEAAIRVIDDVRDRANEGQRGSIDRARAMLEDRIANMRRETDATTLAKAEIEELMGGKGKYKHRPAADITKAARELAAQIDALVDSTLSEPLAGEPTRRVAASGPTAVHAPEMSAVNTDACDLDANEPDGEDTPLLPASATNIASTEPVPMGLEMFSSKAREEHIMTTFLDKLFSKLDIDPGRDLSKLYRKRIVDVRDELVGQSLSKPVQLVRGTSVRNLTSEIVRPAGLKWLNCHQSADTEHATNLLGTRLTDESGKTLFNATRHGTLSAYSVASSEIRKEAAVVRAREVVIAAVQGRSDEIVNQPNGEKAVALDINTISLLSPDTAGRVLGFLRRAAGKPTGGNDEHAMVEEQFHAWDEINRMSKDNDGIDLEIPGHGTVKVKVNVNAFNFGVNDMEHLFVSSSDWGRTRERNTAAMAALIGDLAKNPDAPVGGQVGRWLESPFTDTKQRRAVEELSRQVADLWHSRTFNNPGLEPYKLVSRIAVLTQMIGVHPDFNCKSGKDRTGVLDVEAKYLAWVIDTTGKVPKPDTDRGIEERGNFYRLLMEGGNLETQKWNTGFAGLKQNPVGTQKALDSVLRFFGWFTPIKLFLQSFALDTNKGGKRDIRHISVRAAQGLSSFVGS